MHAALEVEGIVEQAYPVEQRGSSVARTVVDHMKMTCILFRTQEHKPVPVDSQPGFGSLDFYHKAIASAISFLIAHIYPLMRV